MTTATSGPAPAAEHSDANMTAAEASHAAARADASGMAPEAASAPASHAVASADASAPAAHNVVREATRVVERSPSARAIDCPCGCNREETACLFDTMPDEELLYDLADLFKVFADTTRIKILYALMERERCVADIAEIIGATQSAVSHQLRTLKQARLVKFQRDGKNVIYSLSDNHVYTMLAQGMTHLCE